MKRNYFICLLLIIVFFFTFSLVNSWFLNVFATALYTFLSSFFLVFILTPLVKILALKFDILDHPADRKVHKQPIPLLGGLAIYLSFLINVFIFLDITFKMQAFLLASLLFVTMGIIDDKRNLPAKLKLIGQLVASLIVILSGVKVSFLPPSLGLLEVPLEILVSLIWIIGITNAFNFCDGLDGLASGMAMISCFAFFIIGCQLQQTALVLLSIIIIGSCFAFLRYNFKPAGIFLGDAGSTFLGFVLAYLSLLGGWSDKGPLISLGIPVLILNLLIFDMIYITISRVGRGLVTNIKEWIDYVGKDHFHHRLLHLGFTHRQVVWFIYFMHSIFALSAIVLREMYSQWDAAILLFQAFMILLILCMLMIVGRERTLKIRIDKFYSDKANNEK